MKYILLAFFILIQGCGSDTSNCTVVKLANGSQIQCPDGTVENVIDGVDGSPAPEDIDATPSPSPSTSATPCTTPKPSPTPKPKKK